MREREEERGSEKEQKRGRKREEKRVVTTVVRDKERVTERFRVV